MWTTPAASCGTAGSRSSTPSHAPSARIATRSATPPGSAIPAEGVIVLPGTALPEHFPTEGVLPEVERLPLT